MDLCQKVGSLSIYVPSKVVASHLSSRDVARIFDEAKGIAAQFPYVRKMTLAGPIENLLPVLSLPWPFVERVVFQKSVDTVMRFNQKAGSNDQYDPSNESADLYQAIALETKVYAPILYGQT